MPRKSLEALAAYQAVRERPKPPRALGPAAVELWNKIVSERPADFFSEGNIPLLAAYCRIMVQVGRMLRVVESRDPLTEQYAKDAVTLKNLTTMAQSLAVKMRLTQQQQMPIQTAKISERVTPAAMPTAVLGGSAEFTMRAN